MTEIDPSAGVLTGFILLDPDSKIQKINRVDRVSISSSVGGSGCWSFSSSPTVRVDAAKAIMWLVALSIFSS
jgi:hypothetical protein